MNSPPDSVLAAGGPRGSAGERDVRGRLAAGDHRLAGVLASAIVGRGRRGGDALCWYDAKPELAARWSHLPDWGQMLVRALIYRITTDYAADRPASGNAYQPVIDLALTYTT